MHASNDPVVKPPFASLDAWLDWQQGLSVNSIELGLDRVAEVWARLCPEGAPAFPVITVAGTNGKGSCVALIEAMTLAGGYRCASYTSPHLLRYNERIRIDGVPVDDDTLCAAFARIEAARAGVPLTYFEFGTLAAFDLFMRAAPDLAVLEVGLGGRLDAVNLWDAEVALVTRIALDHQSWLGDTLDDIAGEKAGIFRARRPAVIAQRDAPPALRAVAERLDCQIAQLGREFDHRLADGGWRLEFTGADGECSGLPLPLPTLRGGFQLDNASAAVAALRLLRQRLPLAAADLRRGLQRASLPGRFQVEPGAPSWIFDVAHNGDAAMALARNLRTFNCQGRILALLAVLADKDAGAIVTPLLEAVDHWFLSSGEDARALSAQALSERLLQPLAGRETTLVARLDDAFSAVLAAARPDDCIVVFGSFTTVAQVLALRFHNEPAPGGELDTEGLV